MVSTPCGVCYTICIIQCIHNDFCTPTYFVQGGGGPGHLCAELSKNKLSTVTTKILTAPKASNSSRSITRTEGVHVRVRSTSTRYTGVALQKRRKFGIFENRATLL